MKEVAVMACLCLLAGCASVSVTENTLENRTAFALGLDAGDFTISNRQDSGVRTDYEVSTKRGERYACYVTGSVGVVSDAICSRRAGPGKANSSAEPKGESRQGAPCNALLKAAGRC